MIKTCTLILSLLFAFNIHASEKIKQDKLLKAKQNIERVKSHVEKTNLQTNYLLKSASSSNTFLSEISGNWGRKEFTYNSNNSIADYKFYTFDDNSNEELTEHQHFEYDEAGNILLHQLFHLDMMDGWILKEKIEYEYYPDNTIKNKINWQYNSETGTMPISKNASSYDGNEMIDSSFTWNEINEQWEIYSYSIIEINTQGLVQRIESYILNEDTQSLELSSISTIEYNAQGLETSMLLTVSEEGILIDIMRDETQYNSSGEITQYATYLIEDEEEELWDKEVYLYENGNLIKEEIYSLNFFNMETSLQCYVEYDYQQGKLVSRSEFSQNSLTEVFELIQKTAFTYGDDINLSDLVIAEVDEYVNYYNDDIFDIEYYKYGLITHTEHFSKDYDTGELISVKTAEYSYTNNSASLSSDATLSDLLVDDNTIENFDAETFNYDVVLPEDYSGTPNVSADANHANASIEVTQANEIPGTAEIIVRAEDGETVYTYQINFTKQETVYSNDASCSSIYIDGVLFDDFSSDIYEYTISLDDPNSEIPRITAVIAAKNAEADITQAEEIPGSATILVTAEDGTTQLTYVVNFIVTNSVNYSKIGEIKIYPNPVSNALTIKIKKDTAPHSITIYNQQGKKMSMYNLPQNQNKQITIDMSQYSKGLYFVNIYSANGHTVTEKIIKK